MDDLLSILVALAILVIAAVVFVVLSRRIRRGGGSLTTIMLGATDEFMDADKRRAAEEIVERMADKKENRGSEAEPDHPVFSQLPPTDDGNDRS